MGAMPSGPAIGRASGSPPAQFVTTINYIDEGCSEADRAM